MCDNNELNKQISEKTNRNKVENKKKKKECKVQGDQLLDTSNFTIEERLVAAVWVHERKLENLSIAQIKVNFRMRFGKPPPTKNTLYYWEKKIFSTGRVSDGKRSGRPPIRMDYIASVEESLKKDPNLSLRARAERLSVPRSTLKKIMRVDLRIPENIQSKDTSNNKTKPVDPPNPPPKQNVPQSNSHFSFNIVPNPTYSYQENIGVSAFQHYVTYPNNNQHQGPIIPPPHSKIPVNPQNSIPPNMNIAQHVPNHQTHPLPMNHQTYIHSNQESDKHMNYMLNGNQNHPRSQVPSTFNTA